LSELTFRSDIKVELTGHFGTDLDICHAAWVSSGVEMSQEVPEKRQRGLINALMRDRHGTPFEDGYFRFRVEAPRAVRDESVRHRIASFSSSSLRYTLSLPEVYVPSPDRPFIKAEGFKQIQPVYDPMTKEDHEDYVKWLKEAYRYSHMIGTSIHQRWDSTEAARWITTDGHYVRFLIRLNPRSVMHFLSLRTHNEDAFKVSYPMWELDVMGRKMEEFFKEKLPITHEAFNTHGRMAP
jgi:thymidylate synthase (FAD)